MDHNIRSATVADAEALCKFGFETFKETFLGHPLNKEEDVMQYLNEAFTVSQMESEINSDQSEIRLVVNNEAQIIGYIKVNFNVYDNGVQADYPAELQRIYVHSQYKRQGIGKKLMEEAIQIAKQRNCDVLWLGVWEHNTDAIKFYNKQDFNTVGEHVFVLGSDPQTDLILQRKLN